MVLKQKQITQYNEDGFLLLEECFSKEEMKIILDELPTVLSEDSPKRILEKTGAVRSFFAAEQNNDVFRCVTQLDRLLQPVMQFLESEVYIHQTKINSKRAIVGDWWEWHQDFPYWHNEDGMPTSNVLTAMIFLNDVTEFNGPMMVIPGSHWAGIVDDKVNNDADISNDDEWFNTYQKSTPYMSALSANLKYTLKQNTIAKWASKKGIQSMKGPAGSVLFFHGSIFHASSNNMSPWDRNTFLITYNSVNNTLKKVANPRPDFLANQDFTPLVPIHDDSLLRFKSKQQSVDA